LFFITTAALKKILFKNTLFCRKQN